MNASLFWCNERYQFSADLKKSGYGYVAYDWSERYLHYRGQVHLIHTIGTEACEYIARSYIGEIDYDSRLYALRILFIPTALLAWCIRAIGRATLIGRVKNGAPTHFLSEFKVNGTCNSNIIKEYDRFNLYLFHKMKLLDLSEVKESGYTIALLKTRWGTHERSGFINASQEEIDEEILALLKEKKYKALEELLEEYHGYTNLYESLSPKVIKAILDDSGYLYKDKLFDLKMLGDEVDLELIQKIDPYVKDWYCVLYHAYDYGADSTVINYIKLKLPNEDHLQNWLDNTCDLHIEHLRDLDISMDWIQNHADKLKKRTTRELFQAGKLGGDLDAMDPKIKRLVIRYCADLDPKIGEYIEKEQLYGKTITYYNSYIIKTRTPLIIPQIGYLSVIEKTSLPSDWQGLIPDLTIVSEGVYSSCSIGARIRSYEDGYKVSRVAVKVVTYTGTTEEQDLDAAFKKMQNNPSAYLEKKYECCNGVSVGKFYRNGDASNLPPLRAGDSEGLRIRLKILLDACKGAKELIEKYGDYQTDFKLQNIFWKKKGNGEVKAVVGDFGLMTNLKNSLIYGGTFDREAYYNSKNPAFQESRICYQVWVAAKLLLQGKKSDKIKKMLEDLRTCQTLDRAIEIISLYNNP